MKKVFDLAVIGAGPVGLYAAFFATHKGLSTAIIDALPEVGGQLTALYPQKYIFDVAGFPKVTASALVEELKKQVARQQVPLHLGFKVSELKSEPNGAYKITSESGEIINSNYVMIAAGAGMITPRKLELTDADKYLGRGLEYVIRNVEEYRNMRILVIGGGDTALDWAHFLTNIGKEVTLIHRSAKFVGFEGSLIRLQKSSCKIFTDTQLTGIFGAEKIDAVEIANSKEGWTKKLEVDRILGCIGFTPKLGFIKEAGFEIAEGSIRADRNMRTNLDRVYAVGDISNHPGRIKLISTGFGNVQIAINHIAGLEKERLQDVDASQLEGRVDHSSHS